MSGPDELLRRGGRTIAVKRHPTRFVVVSPNALEGHALLNDIGGVSIRALPTSGQPSALFRVTATDGTLERAMAEVRRRMPQATIVNAYVGHQAWSAATFYPTDRIVVRLKEPPGDAFRAVLARFPLIDLGAMAGAAETWRVLCLRPGADANVLRLANELADGPVFEAIEPNLVDRLYGLDRIVPVDALEAKASREMQGLWHLTPDPAVTGIDHVDPRASVRALPDVWDAPPKVTGAGTTVSMIDVDFSANHPDYVGRYANDPSDMNDLQAPQTAFPNHGTCCVGLLAGARNGIGAVGVAPDSRVFAIRLDMEPSTTGNTKAVADDVALCAAIRTAAQHGRLVSMSLSWPPESGGPAASVCAALEECHAGGAGALFFLAAGNDGLPLGIAPPPGAPFKVTVRHADGTSELVTIDHALDDRILRVPGVVVVAASTSKSGHAHYSNWGDGIGIAAPSGARLANEPAPGNAQDSVFVAVKLGVTNYPFSGTSAATPIAVGVAALALSANPGLSAREVREILEDTADQVGDPADPAAAYTLPGRGRQRSLHLGYGKVNAAAAVAEALRRRRPGQPPG